MLKVGDKLGYISKYHTNDGKLQFKYVEGEVLSIHVDETVTRVKAKGFRNLSLYNDIELDIKQINKNNCYLLISKVFITNDELAEICKENCKYWNESIYINNSYTDITKNIQTLYKEGFINKPDFNLATIHCKACKTGVYACSVKTHFGWHCDACLKDELLYLNSLGIHTVASCCGHGNEQLSSILVVSENSKKLMKQLGYKQGIKCNIDEKYSNWKPKSKLIYSEFI